MKDLAIIAKAFTQLPKPSKKIQIFVERNILRLSVINTADVLPFIDICHAFTNGNFVPSIKMKRQINEHFMSCFEQLTSGDNFVICLQILDKFEPEYIEIHFRKINGL
jgi:hypothetical protein